jgi:hypothetical protein
MHAPQVSRLDGWWRIGVDAEHGVRLRQSPITRLWGAGWFALGRIIWIIVGLKGKIEGV